MATSYTDQNSTDEFLIDLLQCPACMETIKSVPVYQCTGSANSYWYISDTHFFSWFNDTLIQNQWYLGLWDKEIWYKTFFSLHQPHMASKTSERKDIKFLKGCGRGAPVGTPCPCPSGSK